MEPPPFFRPHDTTPDRKRQEKGDILPLVLVLMVVTNIITEVLKGLVRQSIPTNILAFLVAMAVTLLAFFAMCQIISVAVTWYLVVAAIVLGVFVAYAAMFGFDKLRQTLEQLDSIKQNQ